MQVLQSLLLPNLEIGNEEAMYLRPNSQAWSELTRHCVHFEPGGLIHTDTFYNALAVAAWKRVCDVRTLALELRGNSATAIYLDRREPLALPALAPPAAAPASR